jgi:carboxylesterase type B
MANPENCDVEHKLLQQALPHPDYTFSDTECLTLNISAPAALAQQKSKDLLPVVFFCHGGGFVTGSASWPQWDAGAFVDFSAKAGTPVIVVAPK